MSNNLTWWAFDRNLNNTKQINIPNNIRLIKVKYDTNVV